MAILDRIVPFRASLWLLAMALLLGGIASAPASGQQSERAAGTAWEELLRRDPAVAEDAALDSLTRRVLHALTLEQAAALAAGATPEEILLADGETLAEYLVRSFAPGPGLVYEPLDQCRLFSTAGQTAPVTGPMAADEIRDFVARGTGAAHTDQGGAGTCLVPDEAVAVVIHFRVVAAAVQGGWGFLKAWAADAPEPLTRVIDYEPVIDPPLPSRLRFTGAAVVELCPFGACAAGELRVKTAQLGGQVRGDVAGFFRPTVAADAPEVGNAQTLDGLDKSFFAAASHTHDGADITSGTVGEPYVDSLIARDDELLPIVLAADGPGSGLDGDTVDGRHADDIKPQLGNCLTVSPSCPAAAPEALAARCWQSIGAALAQIGVGLPAASTTNRYVVKVGPGIYTEQVSMVPFVDIEGAGQKVTTVTFASDGTGTFSGADNAELRSLTAENTGGGSLSVAMAVVGTAPILKDVTLRASGAAFGNIGMAIDGGATPMLSHVTVVAAAETGLDEAISANSSSVVSIRDSVLEGDDDAVLTANGSIANIINTQLIGPANKGAGMSTLNCLSAYDAAFAELGTDCQP